ncbi:hypothetical protein [Acinetobacter nosocomialis]|uniref:hypothetical protein n=1 Tax=Acinetobacter nosocomialis TaxID=106654 RepID=UPI003462DBEA
MYPALHHLLDNTIICAIIAYIFSLLTVEFIGFFVFKIINKIFLNEGKTLDENSKSEIIEEKIETVENGKLSVKSIKNKKKTELINNSKYDRSFIKGVFERIFLSLCMINQIYPLLTVYAALKLGTRLGNSHQVKNDYFLIGNITSILLAMLLFSIFSFFKVI